MTCPNCGNNVHADARYCPACGKNLPDTFSSSTATAPPPTEARCPKCGTNYPPHIRYCPNDGSQLIPGHADVLKPRCRICNRTFNQEGICPFDGGDIRVPGGYGGDLFKQEGGMGRYRKASLGSRFVASLLDGLITVGLALPGVLLLINAFSGFMSGRSYYRRYYSYDDSPNTGMIIFAFMLLLLPLAYSLFKDGLGRGRSWGKQALGLMVVHLGTDRPCSYGNSFVRSIISWLVGMIPYVGWLIEPILVLADNEGRKLGDRAANTQVIETRDYFG